MLKSNKIIISISYRNVSHYLKLGYNAIINEQLEVEVKDLPIVSHVKVDVICEICKSEKKLMYCKYIDNCKRHGFYSCKRCSRQKAVITSRKLYGVDNWMQLESSKNEVSQRNIKKYGTKTTLLLPEIKSKISKTLIEKYGTDKWFEIREPNKNKKFIFIDLDSKEYQLVDHSSRYKEISDESYLLYRNEVRRITKKNIKKLFQSWDGLDYYDKEFILKNFELEHNHKDYPTIDHKISIHYGFTNKISASEIGHLDNLCITKRSINSTKRQLIEEVFKS